MENFNTESHLKCLYKCQLCGVVFVEDQIAGDSVEVALDLHMGKQSVHNCMDSNLGVANFVGLEHSDDFAEED